ncbi:MAG TPA: PTS sugar transporter subunit IIA [Ignavibacteriaceae bacterium]|jgi:fructose-specific phosphotransferase system IIA component
MKVSELLKPEFIVSDLQSETKEEIINELIDLFKNDPRVEDIEKVRTAVLEREKVMSTGVGKGFAIPHGKTNAVKEIVGAFGRIKDGIDYESLDGNPVNLVFLLVGKDNLISTHIKLLSRISRLMNKDDFRHRLMEANSAEEIVKLFSDEEEHFLEL